MRRPTATVECMAYRIAINAAQLLARLLLIGHVHVHARTSRSWVSSTVKELLTHAHAAYLR